MKKSEVESRIKGYLIKWIEPLGLRWWDIETVYHYEPEADYFKEDGSRLLAKTTVQWEYAQAIINFNLTAWRGLSEREIERNVIHELVHILVNEMREGELHHEERVVTGLTRAFLWVYEVFRKEDEE